MQSYILNFQRATAVAAGLERREYRGGFRDSANGYLYQKEVTEDFAVKLLFTKKGDTLGSVGLSMGSRYVTRVMHAQGLFINGQQTPIDEPRTVISVDLLWLRWNRNPERTTECRDDYEFGAERGVQRFFEDLDTAGQDFIKGASAPRTMADLLSGLDKYPCRTTLGGKPVSVHPHIYAAIFYMQLGDHARAKEVLDQGWREHQYPVPRQYWQSIKVQQYQTRRLLLLRHMGLTGAAGEC
jgi:hypothetical protein